MLTLFDLLLFNAAAASVLALVIWMVGRIPAVHRQPGLRHFLWVIVLVKLVTPPVIELPVLPTPSISPGDGRETQVAADLSPLEFPVPPDLVESDDIRDGSEPVRSASQPFPWRLALFLISITGTAAILAVSIRQICLLHRALRQSESNDARLTRIVRQSAKVMGLATVPHVSVVAANISPLLWVRRSGPLVVLPRRLVDQLTDEQLGCVVSHEIAHCLRRDHWTNILSLLVASVFWWHPVVWWARHELRTAQEACSDAMVISRAGVLRQVYAKTLLQALEFIRAEQSLVPALASGFGCKSSTQRRFEMIANQRVSHRLSFWYCPILLVALATLPCLPAVGSADEAVDKNAKADQTTSAKKSAETKKATAKRSVDKKSSNKTKGGEAKKPIQVDKSQGKTVAKSSKEESVKKVVADKNDSNDKKKAVFKKDVDKKSSDKAVKPVKVDKGKGGDVTKPIKVHKSKDGKVIKSPKGDKKVVVDKKIDARQAADEKKKAAVKKDDGKESNGKVVKPVKVDKGKGGDVKEPVKVDKSKGGEVIKATKGDKNVVGKKVNAKPAAAEKQKAAIKKDASKKSSGKVVKPVKVDKGKGDVVKKPLKVDKSNGDKVIKATKGDKKVVVDKNAAVKKKNETVKPGDKTVVSKQVAKSKIAERPYAAVNIPESIELTPDQREKVSELDREFAPKLKELTEKRNAIITPEQWKAGREALNAAKNAGKTGRELKEAYAEAVQYTDQQMQQFQDIQIELKELHKTIYARLNELLTDEQKSQIKNSKTKGSPKSQEKKVQPAKTK